MAWMSRAIGLIQVASRTSSTQLEALITVPTENKDYTYGASPHDPKAGSYRPPGTGFRRLSNVLSFSMRFTEMAWISLAERKVNSTLSTSEATGCAIFMVNSGSWLSNGLILASLLKPCQSFTQVNW